MRKKVFYLGLALITAASVLTIFSSCEKEEEKNNENENNIQSCEAITDTRDGVSYQVVKIGNQCWMSENLRFLPSVSGPVEASETNPIYYVYDFDGTVVADAKATDDFVTYGVLYNFPSALTACPEGWHLPSNEEWGQLEIYLFENGHNYDGTVGGGSDKLAKSMASTTHWTSSTSLGAVGNDLSANNSSGFTALPGSYRHGNGSFPIIGYHGSWWTATEDSPSVFYRYINFDNSEVFNSFGDKDYGFSVRCVKN